MYHLNMDGKPVTQYLTLFDAYKTLTLAKYFELYIVVLKQIYFTMLIIQMHSIGWFKII